MKYYYNNGLIYEWPRYGAILGNIKDGIIRNGWAKGHGCVLGSVKHNIIKDGWCQNSGHALGNVDNGIIRDGWHRGFGNKIGYTKDYIIYGMEKHEAEMIACWHFLIDPIF